MNIKPSPIDQAVVKIAPEPVRPSNHSGTETPGYEYEPNQVQEDIEQALDAIIQEQDNDEA